MRKPARSKGDMRNDEHYALTSCGLRQRDRTSNLGHHPRRAKHRPHHRRTARLYFADNLEPIPFVKRDISRIGRFQISDQIIAVADLKSVFHKRGAETVSLPCRIDTYHREVPVRLLWMKLVH